MTAFYVYYVTGNVNAGLFHYIYG